MKQLLVFSLIIMSFFTACSALTLQPANFSWPIESVLAVDNEGNIAEDRYSIEFNTTGLFYEEFQDSLAYKGKEIRLIRNNLGNYFVTGKKFKNVYVFKACEGTLVLEKKIFISEFGLNEPAFNQRTPYIELLDGDYKINLTSESIEGGSK
ncbi:MAG: hypothetical protein OEM46_01635 [Ignavibacteria bacterium]|nr:hypothetical protein [Ignavibacteria bacterium]